MHTLHFFSCSLCAPLSWTGVHVKYSVFFPQLIQHSALNTHCSKFDPSQKPPGRPKWKPSDAQVTLCLSLQHHCKWSGWWRSTVSFYTRCLSFPEFLLPYKARPATNASVARNLVAGALGLTSAIDVNKSREDKKKLQEARGEPLLWASHDGLDEMCGYILFILHQLRREQRRSRSMMPGRAAFAAVPWMMYNALPS